MDWLDRKLDDETGEITYASSNRIPLLMQMRDPRTVYPSFGWDGLMYVVEEVERTVEDIQASYGEDVLRGREQDQLVTWTEYWDSKRFAYWADGEFIPVAGATTQELMVHDYGTIPYSFEYCRPPALTAPATRIRPVPESQTGILVRQNILAGPRAD